MSLSQKKLEEFLWEQPVACYKRGFYAWQNFFANGRRYRHLRLDPYGVAQQVNIRFDVARNTYFVQVVVSTTGTITAAHYHQAQQQLAALRVLLQYASWAGGLKALMATGCVLVGRRVQPSRELAAAMVHSSFACKAFTWRYEADGLHFEQESTLEYLRANEGAALSWLVPDLLAERTNALAIAEAGRADALAALSAAPPTELADLVVTPAGVLAAPGATQPAPPGQLSLFAPPVLPVDLAAATLGTRLGQIAQYIGRGKVGHLAKVVGLPAPVLHNLAADRHAPSFETLQQLLTALPQISPVWLVLGQGPMLTTPTTPC